MELSIDKNNPWYVGTISAVERPFKNPNDDFLEIVKKLKMERDKIDPLDKLISSKKSSDDTFPPVATIDRREDEDYIAKIENVYERSLLLVLCELISQGAADFIFIEYPELAEYWNKHRQLLGNIRGKEELVRQKEELRQSALKKLTAAEKQALGIK